MPSLCQASYSILALRDEDLGNLNVGSAHSSQGETLVERRIDIKLGCTFAGNGPENSNCKLEVVAWKNGTTDLCGSCSFCDLLADSMQQSVESDRWDAWNLSSKLDPAVLSQPFDLRGTTHFEKLEYQKHRTLQTVDKFSLRSMSSYWDVSLLLLSGYVLLYPKDMDPGEESKRIEVDLAFELFGEEDDPVVKLLGIHRRPLYGPRLSNENVAKIRYWISDCDENHDICFPDSKNLDYKEAMEAMTFLPTRMIEVGDTLNDKHSRLVITSEMQARTSKDEATKYMALSYCWGQGDGTSKLLKTTHDTIRSRTEKIELDTMPQAFRDAVIVARTLGIQYLWIDSLCIIQDDARDWQIESSKMAEIFSNAYLTLVAASGSGCNDSFLSLGLPSLSCAVPLRTNQGLAIQGQFSLRFRPHRGPYDKMTEIRGSKWVTRGWTFQEERLARRVLMFGKTKFFFDCRSLERSQDTDRCGSRPDWVISVTEGLREDRGVNLESTEIGRRWDHWQTLCTHYSFRELSFPEDKLPAISGMASKIAKEIQSEYLAGLWRKNLTHDLFWQTVTIPTEPKRCPITTKPKKYRAPSWSWASFDGRINWPLQRVLLTCSKCSIYCTILDAQTTLVGLDPYGAVKDGFLKVRGVFEEMKVMWVGGDRSQHPWRLYHEGGEIGNVNLDMESDTIQVHGQENIYQALLVAGCKSFKESSTIIRGLLLKKNGRKRENYDEFERVGTFALFSGVVPGQYGNLGIWNSDAEQVIMIV
ncbi:HET-domain-containing protein [Acephala macrosclerotiorum]|nr:HET-domain-containing protein [Acephala macrosclerotiorum]